MVRIKVEVFVFNYFSRTGSTFLLKELSKITNVAAIPEFDYLDNYLSVHEEREDKVLLSKLGELIAQDVKLPLELRERLLLELTAVNILTTNELIERTANIHVDYYYQGRDLTVVIIKSMLWMYNPKSFKLNLSEKTNLFLTRDPKDTLRSQISNVKLDGKSFAFNVLDYYLRYRFYCFCKQQYSDLHFHYDDLGQCTEALLMFLNNENDETKFVLSKESKFYVPTNQKYLHVNVARSFGITPTENIAVNAFDKVAKELQLVQNKKGIYYYLSFMKLIFCEPAQIRGHVKRGLFVLKEIYG